MPVETFGVEIEFTRGPGCDDDLILAEFAREGLAIEDSRRTHLGSHHRNWTLKRDGSVFNGGELVSPPLKFNNEEDRKQVDRAVACMLRAGAQPHTSAGIHVHIGCQDFNAIQLAAMCRFTYKFEDVLYRIASSGWEKIRPGALGGYQYAKPLSCDMVKKITKVRKMQTLEKAWGMLDSGLGAGDRYQAVNLNSWGIRGTVEFRLFNSSLNSERIQAYIAICAAIVRDARNGKRTGRSTAKNYPLGTMKRELGQRQGKHWNQHPAFIRFQQVIRYEAGLSKEDWKRVLMCWKDSVPQDAYKRGR